MNGKMKVGVFLFAMPLLALAGPTLAATAPPPPELASIPTTGINTDGYFPWYLDPICGFQVTVHGSRPSSFYNAGRNPWGAPVITAGPNNTWILTFGNQNPNNGPIGPCFDRNNPIFKECGEFKGLHFGFYTDDSIINFLDQETGHWTQNGPACVYFGQNGQTVPCSGLSSHFVGYVSQGHVGIVNGSVLAKAEVDAGVEPRAFKIQNVRMAVAADLVAINNLNPCDLNHLNWEQVTLADSLLPASTDGKLGTLDVVIPERIRAQKGWAVMVYDVTDPETGELLTTSTLEFPIGK